MRPIEDLVSAARYYVEHNQPGSARLTYEMILRGTSPPKTAVEMVSHGEACVFMAKVALRDGQLGQAGDWYREALDVDPRAGDYRAEYVIHVLIPMGLREPALTEAERATRIDPDNYRCWRALGVVRHEIGPPNKCLEARRRAVELAPDNSMVWLDLAATLLDMQQYAEVCDIAETIRARWSDRRGDGFHLLAMVAYREGRHEEAIGLFDRAIELGCYDDACVRWNKALPLQSLGLYKEGWKLYNARFDQITDPVFAMSAKRFRRPMWAGELPPAKIHLHAEMGHGDVIAMARFAPLLASRGYDISLEVGASMVGLLKYSMPTVNVVENALNYPRSLGLPDFDYHLPLLSCPTALGVDVESIPWNGPYLKAESGWVDHWAKILRLSGFGIKRVGLCWSSGIRKNKGIWLSEYGNRKSMSFDQLLPLMSHDIDYVSLQCGDPADETGILPGLSHEEPSWAETAGLIENLDLVITVDSAVAHLAGAMGKPVWVMMHTEGSWHWMTEKAWGGRCAVESPWYPGARLFRQKKANEWRDVIAAINAELGIFISS